MSSLTVVQKLVLKYKSLKTMYEGGCEVRHYRNELTGVEQVGKRIDTLGLEESVAVREGKLLQTIRHDNVVPVFDVVEVEPGYDPAQKLLELIMPYYPRGSLHDALVRGQRFSVGESCLHAQACLRGLGELHERYRILHRDLKSPNVFLPDDGSLLRVGDLGVAVPLDSRGSAEPYPSVQLYTPPETFKLNQVDRRYDLYAVGVLLLEMLNGPLPYDDYTTEGMQKRLAKGLPAVRPEDLVPGPHVPKRLRTIIRKLVSKNPVDRYASAGMTSEAISRVELIDWRPVERCGDSLVWEGESAQRRDRRFQVEAVPNRSNQWVMSARQQVNRWQRFLPDQLVPAPTGSEATAFFDQVVNAAFSP